MAPRPVAEQEVALEVGAPHVCVRQLGVSQQVRARRHAQSNATRSNQARAGPRSSPIVLADGTARLDTLQLQEQHTKASSGRRGVDRLAQLHDPIDDGIGQSVGVLARGPAAGRRSPSGPNSLYPRDPLCIPFARLTPKRRHRSAKLPRGSSSTAAMKRILSSTQTRVSFHGIGDSLRRQARRVADPSLKKNVSTEHPVCVSEGAPVQCVNGAPGLKCR